MPLVKREIEPVHVSRVPVAQGIQNELEYVTNASLANIIRQLSSLAHHAEDIFSELSGEAVKFFDRTNTLHRRIETLRIKVTQLDSTGEEGKIRTVTCPSEIVLSTLNCLTSVAQ